MWLAFDQLEKSKSRVFIGDAKPRPQQAEFGFWRVSELHPVDKTAFSIPEGTDFHLAFIVHPSAFKAIGALGLKQRANVLYGPGLASIVMCTDKIETITEALAGWTGQLRAHEIWQVSNNILIEHDTKLADPDKIDLLPLRLPNHKIKNPDLSWIIWELELNLERFVHLSIQYAPSNISRCKKWARSLGAVITELEYLDGLDRGETATTPDSISSSLNEILRKDSFLRKQRSNANMDRLVHVNSSLIYATSQAFYGGVPSRLSFPLTSPHSLLGIGTAWFALRNLCSFIEQVFERFSVAKIITDQFPKLPWKEYLEIKFDTPKFNYEKDGFAQNSYDEVRPKITFFSSRLGFGESDFSVTCAMQTLHAASSSRYTLMTVSHEMLHAHVRSLITSIFTQKADGGDNLTFSESLRLCIEEFLAYKKTKSSTDLKLIHTVRFLLIHFMLQYRIYSEKANALRGHPDDNLRHLPEFGVTIPSTSPLWEKAFRAAHRFMEEIFVHTLDFHYFYSADTETYIDSLWTSWEHVPSVSDKLEWYILRTLVAIATTVNGPGPCERFDAAKILLEERLTDLNSQNNKSGVINRVLELLDNENGRRWLLLMFVPSIAVGDLIVKYLMDSRIAVALRADDSWTVRGDSDRISHTLPELAFEERAVENPVIFIYERLAKALLARSSGGTGDDELEKTAWMFLAMGDYANESEPPGGQARP